MLDNLERSGRQDHQVVQHVEDAASKVKFGTFGPKCKYLCYHCVCMDFF